MITIMNRSRQAWFAMPACDMPVAAAVRALPSTGGVSAVAADVLGSFDGTTVPGYRHVTDVAVIKGAFPGTSAWSPPI